MNWRKGPGVSETGRAAASLARAIGTQASDDRVPHTLIGVARLSIVNALRVQITRMAAALSYRTVFSLIPTLVIGLVLLGATRSEDQVRDAVSQVLKFSGLADISVGTPSAGSTEASAARLDDWIAKLVEGVRNIPFKAIGFIGMLALLYAALSMMVEIETAFNHVYRAPGGRPWKYRITQYFTTLVLGPVFLIASFYIGEQFRSWVAATATGELTPVRDYAILIAGYLTTVCISTLLFFTLFLTMPNTAVKAWPALCGAVLSAVLWEFGKWGFARFVLMAGSSAMSSYARLYGGIALIPLFLLWIYYTWLIVLAGLQLSYSMQMYRDVRVHGMRLFARLLNPDAPDQTDVVDVGLTLPIMALAASGFASGKTLGAGEVAQEFGIAGSAAEELLGRLVNSGLLHRVEVAGQAERTYAMSRPPEAVAASEVVASACPSESCRQAELVRELAKVRDSGLAGKTLRDLIGNSSIACSTQAPSPAKPLEGGGNAGGVAGGGSGGGDGVVRPT